MTKSSIRRRSLVTVVAVAAVIGVFLVKLVDIQVVHAADLVSQSTKDRSVTQTMTGLRGSIVDANGVTLAASVQRWNIQISPSVAKQEATHDGQAKYTKDTDAIGTVTGLGGAKIRQIIDDALTVNPDSQYAPIVDGIDVTKLNKLTALNIPWLYAKRTQARTYPDGAVAGNIVGFVGSEGQAQAGIELAQNSCLAGENGATVYQRGADNVPIPGSSQTTKKAKDGGEVVLTIDSDLQWFAQQKLAEAVTDLGGTSGIVTVMEAKTGKLKAVAEYPSVDPNNVSGSDPKYLNSRAFTSPFEPGSTFKPITAAALINDGLATPTSQVLAPYHFTSGHGASLYDAFYHDDWRLTLTGVLMWSSNTGISKLGSRLSDKEHYDYLKKFGIGTKTAVDFPGESGGILNPYQGWDDQTRYATMFGQGVSATAIQIASVYQTLGNDGVRLPVQLVEGCKQPDGSMTEVPSTKGERVVSASTAKQVVGMLESVVTGGEVSKELTIPGYRVAAKTGTAQQADGNGGYKSTYLVSVTGLAPAGDPQYVVSVNIANPVKIRTSAAAAPLFKTMMSQVLKTYRVKPSTTPSPNYPPYY
ncbi:penicillin-binding protein 2 [Microbacterium sp. STN6]|uniref:peptidoglycan D,D-transpeptidase FtsI family protein n=1 Tax=Microbacterium sp. STN6 TaxID=2995588 RepID=UPI0022610063|nr:penicillin-binding protein 2 [Microbacterium sp. STN6]MCX7521505.1 penicillin-binding protein 2 [Microbacterium sp. STN6]